MYPLLKLSLQLIAQNGSLTAETLASLWLNLRAEVEPHSSIVRAAKTILTDAYECGLASRDKTGRHMLTRAGTDAASDPTPDLPGV